LIAFDQLTTMVNLKIYKHPTPVSFGYLLNHPHTMLNVAPSNRLERNEVCILYGFIDDVPNIGAALEKMSEEQIVPVAVPLTKRLGFQVHDASVL
jgi:hypothetical protein